MAIRNHLLNRGLAALINLGQGVFGNNVLNTSTIFICQTMNDDTSIILGDFRDIPHHDKRTALIRTQEVEWSQWKNFVRSDASFTFFVSNVRAAALLSRLRADHTTLEKVLDGGIQRGLSPDVVAAHVLSDKEAVAEHIEPELLHPGISGRQIKRYSPWISDQLIIYTDRLTPIDKLPHTKNYMTRFRHLNTCKEVIQGKHPWWSLHRPRHPEIFSAPKFIGITTSRSIELIYDDRLSAYVTDAMYVFKTLDPMDPYMVMALLHSRLFLFLYRVANQGESRVIPQVKASKLTTLPYPTVGTDLGTEAALAQRGTDILVLHQRLAEARTAYDRGVIQRQIEATDRQIDRLVYELYGLTEEEIQLVEESMR
jgi:hypothetical protein